MDDDDVQLPPVPDVVLECVTGDAARRAVELFKAGLCHDPTMVAHCYVCGTVLMDTTGTEAAEVGHFASDCCPCHVEIVPVNGMVFGSDGKAIAALRV